MHSEILSFFTKFVKLKKRYLIKYSEILFKNIRSSDHFYYAVAVPIALSKSAFKKGTHKRQNSINERVTSIIKFVFAAELENLSPQPPYYVRKKRSTCKNRRRQRAAGLARPAVRRPTVSIRGVSFSERHSLVVAGIGGGFKK